MDLKSKVQSLTQPKFNRPPPDDSQGMLDETPSPVPPQPRTERQAHVGGAGQGDELRVSVGSRVAPRRPSSADKIDARAARATGRNSRLFALIRPEHLDVFKAECIRSGVKQCEAIEEMIEARWPKLFPK